MDKKKLIAGAVVGCAALAGVAAALKERPASSKAAMWDKMREGMEEMPEDFPPRVMYDNVEAARVNSERILDLLQKYEPSEDDIQVIKST